MNRLWLVRNGVPWSEAWSLDEAEVIAAMVVFGQFEGNEFDWRFMRWKQK